ncbi:hypothetical protein [Mucilaginibacter sp. 3215]|uniref:hypothetical protein n=1 Tax=Mucilaginibacter sp. 3215 TaxID=3373912 RepID=UPI003D21E980
MITLSRQFLQGGKPSVFPQKQKVTVLTLLSFLSRFRGVRNRRFLHPKMKTWTGWLPMFLLGCLFCNLVKAQSYELVNILPPAPNAASLSKYAGVNTGLSSGSANFSVPLLTYTSKSVSFPIAINYATSGFKVDEIASRTGNQWSLNAGGMISRTVFGSVDETSARIYPKPSLGESTETDLFMFEQKLSSTLPLEGVGPNGAVDGQPDIFSFNFDKYSGKFILDTIGPNHTLQPVMLANSGLKIVFSGAGSGFTITAPDGIQYVFGEDAIEMTAGSSSCATPYSSNATAWYLKRIIHPDGDVATFYYSPLTYSYNTGISQSVYAFTGSSSTVYNQGCNPQGYVTRPQPANSSCVTTLETKGVLLDSITSAHGYKVKFDYVTRDDDNDRLISAINIYDPGRVRLLKKFALSYTYGGARPFLTALSEYDGASQLLSKYKFGYNDIYAVPASLSFGQDYWGFYNGKSNLTAVPRSEDPGFQQSLPSATANRHPDPVYAAKGLLNAVTYPTGGKDSIVYEGNQAYQVKTVYPTQQTLSYTATNNTGSVMPGTQISPTTAVISVSQQVTFYGNCTALSSLANSTRQATIQILDANNNVVDNAPIQPGNSFTKTRILDPGTYKVAVVLYGDYVRGKVNLSYFSGAVTNQLMNVDIGGVRIAKILTYDGVSASPIIKKYLYNKFSDPSQSSAETVNIPYFERHIKLWVQCTGGGLCYDGIPFDFDTSTSSAAYSLSVTPSPATYANVTESFGENFENGGIEHIFTVSQDKPAAVFKGLSIYGVPSGNESYKNGKELYQGTFKLQGGQRIYTQKVYTHYKEDTGFAGLYNGYIGTENYHLYCTGNNTPAAIFYQRRNYNTSYYFIHRAWVYADTVITLNYDLNGQNYTQNIESYQYGNMGNALPTTVTKIASNGDVLKTVYAYPADFSTNAPYDAMVAKNIVSPIVVKTRYNGSTSLDAIKTNYYNWGGNIFEPQTVNYQTKNNSYETRLRYYSYDNMGNATSFSKESGPKISYVWGYKGLYPIAKVENAEYSVVVSALGGAAAVENFKNIPNPTNAQINSFLLPLRSNIGLKGSLITSNTYDPLTGLTTSTDPKGETTYYEYDSAQRLSNVKDKDGNIVKHIDYHYQGQ